MKVVLEDDVRTWHVSLNKADRDKLLNEYFYMQSRWPGHVPKTRTLLDLFIDHPDN